MQWRYCSLALSHQCDLEFGCLKQLILQCFVIVENISALNTGSTTSAHYLVLTDVEGNRSYATCLRFYKRYVMSRVCQGGTMLKMWNINLMRGSLVLVLNIICEFNTLCVELFEGWGEWIYSYFSNVDIDQDFAGAVEVQPQRKHRSNSLAS